MDNKDTNPAAAPEGQAVAATGGSGGASPPDDQPHLKRVLKTSNMVYYGIAYIMPLTIFTTFGLATVQTHGMLSLAFVVTTLAMAFTAFSYSKMVRAYPVAGAVYTYAKHSINPYMGFMSGWVILTSYLLLPCLSTLSIAVYLNQAMPFIPRSVWILAIIAIVGFVCYRGIELTMTVNTIIVWIQIAFIIALAVFIVRFVMNGGVEGAFFTVTAFFNAEEFSKPGVGMSAILAACALLTLSFLGFDGIATLSEEAINPTKTVGRAIVIVTVVMGIYFVVITYILTCTWPNAWFEMVDPETSSYEFMMKVGGSVLAYLFTGGFCAGAAACALSCQTSAARMLFGMGRDGMLPKFFSKIHPKYKTPSNSVIVVACLCTLALFLNLEMVTSLVNCGALLGFTMVNVCVIAHYIFRKKERSFYAIMSYLISPLIGAFVCFSVWLGLNIPTKLLGIGWIVLGIIYLMWKTKFFRELPPDLDKTL